jgi:carboxypeptidase family protein
MRRSGAIDTMTSMRNHILGWLGTVVLSVLAAACSSAPPAQLGVVRGVAVDSYGNVLPGITVSLQAPDGKLVQTVTTGEDGGYNFPAVPVGQYQVLSTFAGYTTPKPLDAKVTPSGLAYLPRLVLVPPQ